MVFMPSTHMIPRRSKCFQKISQTIPECWEDLSIPADSCDHISAASTCFEMPEEGVGDACVVLSDEAGGYAHSSLCELVLSSSASDLDKFGCVRDSVDCMSRITAVPACVELIEEAGGVANVELTDKARGDEHFTFSEIVLASSDADIDKCVCLRDTVDCIFQKMLAANWSALLYCAALVC